MSVDVTADGWVDDETGNGVPNDCEPSDWRTAEVLVPIFDETNGLNGTNGEYHIVGFAGFTMSRLPAPGNEWQNGFPAAAMPEARRAAADLHLR